MWTCESEGFLLIFLVLFLVLIFNFLDYRGVGVIYEHSLSLHSYKCHCYPCGFIDYTCERPQWEIGVDKY